MKALKKGGMIFLLFSSVTFAQEIVAPMLTADWRFSKGESSCQLAHSIPLYGMADFTHQSGDLLRFSVREERFKPAIVKASLFVDSPPWLHASAAYKDYLVYLDEGVNIQNIPRLSVYGETAELMLDALSDGLSPRFSYVRASAQGVLPETRVSISAINFSANYQQFDNCRKNFLPFGLKDVLEKSLFFKSGSQTFNQVVLTQINNTARYIKEVKGSKVVIVSNTAITGGRDKKWFNKRAKAIAKKLNSLGVLKSKVSIKNGFYTASTNNKIIQLNVFGPDAVSALYYRKSRINLTTADKQRLNLIVRYQREFMPNARLIIKSHTDGKGRRANNLVISKKRGEEVKRYLVSQGLDEKSVQVKAYGETRPVKSNRFPKGRAQNRRVTIGFVA